VRAGGESLAYVIYTSGSTGLPKGALGIHRGILNRLNWMWETYPFAVGEVCCQKTSLSFVDSVWEIFGPLLQGIPTIIIPDAVLKEPRDFLAALANNNITRLVLVPSLLRVLLNDCDDLQSQLPKLKVWVVSGEALPLDLAQQFTQAMPEAALLNLYGSSEVSADVTWYDVSENALASCVPIGRPLANTQVYLLDSHQEPVPEGVSGELYIGGDGLARGYLHRPRLTAEKFIPDRFGGVGGARLYRTGDVARYLAGGQIEFLGRIDRQVKIRGFRIEPAEIRAALAEHWNVREVTIMVREDSPGDKRLVAYLVAERQPPPSTNELRRFLNNKLPDHMIPSSFNVLDALPLMPNGKIDQQALLAAVEVSAGLEVAYLEPQSEVEQNIARVWQELLHVEKVGIEDNFFDLGGHSLLMIKLQNRLQKVINKDISLIELFQYPTISSMTKYLAGSRGDEATLKQLHDRAGKQKDAMTRQKRLVQERKMKR
jgi:amino acid adenylation domain-containing protein